MRTRKKVRGDPFAIAGGVTGCLLSGGQGKRMNGLDKGLMMLRGKHLAFHGCSKLAPQVDSMLIIANRNITQYKKICEKTVCDHPHLKNKGPLSGILTAMKHVQTEYIMVIPCDSPFFPETLVRELAKPVLLGQASLSTVLDRSKSVHPTFLFLPVLLRQSLENYLLSGRSSVKDWINRHNTAKILLSEKQQFKNINTTEDLDKLNNTK